LFEPVTRMPSLSFPMLLSPVESVPIKFPSTVVPNEACCSHSPMELPEIKALIDDWIATGAISTCPHGRRTSFKLSTQDLEKMFGRAGW